MTTPPILKSMALASVAGNAALAVCLALRLSDSASRPPQNAAPAAEIAVQVPASFPETSSWESLAAGTSREVAERMRREKFPLSVQRAVVMARLKAEFAARQAALATAQAALPYWRTDPEGIMADPRLDLERRRLKRDFENQLRALIEPGRSSLTEIQQEELQRNYGRPAPEKLEKLHAIQVDYTEMVQLVQREARLRFAPPDQALLAELERQRLVDLNELLTPAELENFELRNSSTGQRLSGELIAFDFSDDEFRSLFRIERKLEERFGLTVGNSFPPAVVDQLNLARIEEIRGALGPERFARYQLTTAPGYRETNRFVIEQNLPATMTADLLAIRQDVTQRAENLRRSGLPADSREAQLAALGTETRARLAARLGPPAAAAYAQLAGQWIPKAQGTTP